MSREDWEDTSPADLEWRRGLGRRLDKQDSLLDKLCENQEDHKNRLDHIEKSDETILEFFEAWKGAMAFFGFINRMIKPFVAIAGLALAAWSAWKATGR